jgi:hypothetical protein
MPIVPSAPGLGAGDPSHAAVQRQLVCTLMYRHAQIGLFDVHHRHRHVLHGRKALPVSLDSLVGPNGEVDRLLAGERQPASSSAFAASAWSNARKANWEEADR